MRAAVDEWRAVTAVPVEFLSGGLYPLLVGGIELAVKVLVTPPVDNVWIDLIRCWSMHPFAR